MTITRLSEWEYMFVTSTGQATRDAHFLRSVIRPEEFCSVVDVTSAWGVLSVMGPQSRQLLQACSTADLSNEV